VSTNLFLRPAQRPRFGKEISIVQAVDPVNSDCSARLMVCDGAHLPLVAPVAARSREERLLGEEIVAVARQTVLKTMSLPNIGRGRLRKNYHGPRPIAQTESVPAGVFVVAAAAVAGAVGGLLLSIPGRSALQGKILAKDERETRAIRLGAYPSV
jgi:hypothetical protein